MTGAGAGGPDARSRLRFWDGWSTATWWAVGLVGVHVVLGLLLYEPVLYTGGDNAGYMILGDALRGGEGYRDLYRPGTPLHTKYPPGYPALLAMAGLFGGLQLFKMLSLAGSAAGVALTYLLGRRLADARLGVAAAAVVAVNPLLLQYSHWVLTEVPFTVAVLAALVLYTRGDAAGRTDAAWKPGLAAAASAFLVRVAGAPVLAAAVATHLTRREWRRAGVAGLLSTGLVGGWFLYQRLVPAGKGYLEEFARVGAGWSAGETGPLALLERGVSHFWYYADFAFPRMLFGSAIDRGEAALLVGVAGIVLSGLALVGWVLRSKEGMGLPEWFALLYAGLISLWWRDLRFLLPLFPLLVVYLLIGARRLAEGAGLASVARRGVATVAVAVLLVLPGVVSAARLVPERVACVAGYRAGSPCLPGSWISFHAAARWAASEVPDGAVVMSRKPRIFYWLSGHRGDVYPFTHERSAVLRRIEEMGADFVVADALSESTAQFLVPVIMERLDRFRPVYSEGEPRTTVFRVLAEPADRSDGEG